MNEKLFKIELSEIVSIYDGYIFHYKVCRRNFFGKFKQVATVRLYCGDKLEIKFTKFLRISERKSIVKYFDDLVKIKIEPQEVEKFNYVSFRNEKNQFEKIAFVISDFRDFTIYPIATIPPHQTIFLSQYFREEIKRHIQQNSN